MQSLTSSNVVFQFHYGTIKSVNKRHTPMKCHYFNSTMVRLKELKAAPAKSNMLFQFHYGTIKSVSDLLSGQCRYLFQFHYGTIKR